MVPSITVANPILSNVRYPQLSDKQSRRWVSEAKGTYKSASHSRTSAMPPNRRKTSQYYN